MDFPIEHGDFPIEHGDFPIENGDFPLKMVIFPLNMVIFHWKLWFSIHHQSQPPAEPLGRATSCRGDRMGGEL